MVAHDWPFTIDNIVCEAWAYHHSDWDFMDSLVTQLEEQELEVNESLQATQLVVEATTKATDKSLLKYALSLRAYSPQCELHRGLARQALLFHEKQGVSLNAFVVSGSAIFTEVNDLATCTEASGAETELLPGEVPREATTEAPVVVLYANMTTRTFVDWYRALVNANIPFVVRHLGHSWYEEVGGTPTVLQGYGVRLDIRNVEYRVFDDRDEQPTEKAAMMNVTSLSTLSTQFLAGVNVSALGLDKEKALPLQRELYKQHEAQQLHAQIIPPSWQRRKLSLQAAQAVASSSSDVLMTLQDVSQNLPSVASTLVHVEIPDELSDVADHLEGLLSQTGGAALFVNGRRVPIDRPSFNVFEFLNMIKSEQAELESMETRLSPYLSLPGLRKVQKAWCMGPDALTDTEEGTESEDTSVFRIDVGRGGQHAILYVNDIEKDEQYANWPRSVQNMIFAMQYGAPPTVRRNMFTVLAAVDPLFDDAGNNGISLGNQLMQGQFPVRLGVLVVSQDDLDKCAKWVEETNPAEDVPCPIDDMFAPGSTPSLEMMENLDASTQAAYLFLAYVIENHGVVAPSYMQYWMQTIAQYKEKRGDPLTVHDLVMIHAQLMSGMHVMSMDEAINDAKEVIKAPEDVLAEGDFPNYGKAVRFALSKGIKPGMSFINGRPLPSGEDDKAGRKVGEIFMEEQHYIMKLIMAGEITDSRYVDCFER